MLSEALKDNHTLTALYLSSNQQKKECDSVDFLTLTMETENNIGSEGCRLFGEVLEENATLSVLDLGGYPSKQSRRITRT